MALSRKKRHCQRVLLHQNDIIRDARQQCQVRKDIVTDGRQFCHVRMILSEMAASTAPSEKILSEVSVVASRQNVIVRDGKRYSTTHTHDTQMYTPEAAG